jgi:ABC-type siderophore export system fused ATPase/permease subunit
MKMEATSAAFGIGTLALINAGLAEQKGRSRLIWFLISLVAGPIATLIIVVLDRPQPLP